MLELFLSREDAGRATRVIQKLARHNIDKWALTGGLANEIHHLRQGCKPLLRNLTDIDFVTGSFDDIPQTLPRDFLFRHAHPLDPSGKTLLQPIDANEAIRVDVFRACGETMGRTIETDLLGMRMRLISVEDLAARTTRLALDLTGGIAVPSKYARDFLRLSELVDPVAIEAAWQDQRRPSHPPTFEEAKRQLQPLIASRTDLLITPTYSTDTEEICARCTHSSVFPQADLKQILSLLGYC